MCAYCVDLVQFSLCLFSLQFLLHIFFIVNCKAKLLLWKWYWIKRKYKKERYSKSWGDKYYLLCHFVPEIMLGIHHTPKPMGNVRFKNIATILFWSIGFLFHRHLPFFPGTRMAGLGLGLILPLCNGIHQPGLTKISHELHQYSQNIPCSRFIVCHLVCDHLINTILVRSTITWTTLTQMIDHPHILLLTTQPLSDEILSDRYNAVYSY